MSFRTRRRYIGSKNRRGSGSPFPRIGGAYAFYFSIKTRKKFLIKNKLFPTLINA